MTNDETDDCYGLMNMAKKDSSHLGGLKLSVVITLKTEW